MNDVRDILNLHGSEEPGTSAGRKSLKKQAEAVKRPEGMHRELFALLRGDGGINLELAPLLPTDTPGGYKQKVNLGAKKVRNWKWTGFTNPGRKDGAVFYHWKRVGDESREYPFAKFNKEVPILKYSEQEYAHNLEKEGWTKEETDHLFDLARRFDLRFPVMQARYERGLGGSVFPKRTIEDIKERYYYVTGVLAKLRAEPGQEPKAFIFDAEHERRRKEQLNKLWNRTPEQVEEEEFLRSELKKIEARKKEREKKTQDLQKLITAADGGGGTPVTDPLKKGVTDSTKKSGSVSKKKSGKTPLSTFLLPTQDLSFFGVKWPDFKNPGVTMRSGRMKLPGSVGQKKAKAIEAMLVHLGVDLHPLQDEVVCSKFNDLRSDIVLHYELKTLLSTCDQEIQSLKHQYEAVKPGETLEIPKELESIAFMSATPVELKVESVEAHIQQAQTQAHIPEVPVILPNRKRKAALEQGNIMKKLKNKV